jgi:hypothetical protein
MLELNAADFYMMTTNLVRLRQDVTKILATQQSPSSHKALAGILSEESRTIRRQLYRIGAQISGMMASELEILVGQRPIVYGDILRMLDAIDETLRRELSIPTLLVLQPDERAKFAPYAPLFGQEVADSFPTEVAFDIDEAGKCLALGRPVAAVFHLMRVMESGLRAVARCLQIPDPVKPGERNWGFILKLVRAGINAKWPTVEDRMEGSGQDFDGLYASLDAVKNPWRNASLHVDRKYTDDEAEHIFVAVRGFMKRLASQCDENGEPLA